MTKQSATPRSLDRIPADLSYCLRLLIGFDAIEVDHGGRLREVACGPLGSGGRAILSPLGIGDDENRVHAAYLGNSSFAARPIGVYEILNRRRRDLTARNHVSVSAPATGQIGETVDILA